MKLKKFDYTEKTPWEIKANLNFCKDLSSVMIDSAKDYLDALEQLSFNVDKANLVVDIAEDYYKDAYTVSLIENHLHGFDTDNTDNSKSVISKVRDNIKTLCKLYVQITFFLEEEHGISGEMIFFEKTKTMQFLEFNFEQDVCSSRDIN